MISSACSSSPRSNASFLLRARSARLRPLWMMFGHLDVLKWPATSNANKDFSKKVPFLRTAHRFELWSFEWGSAFILNGVRLQGSKLRERRFSASLFFSRRSLCISRHNMTPMESCKAHCIPTREGAMPSWHVFRLRWKKAVLRRPSTYEGKLMWRIYGDIYAVTLSSGQVGHHVEK